MNKLSTIAVVILVIGISIVTNFLLIHFESAVDGSSITSWPNAYWYLIVTLSTVGYGDYYPISTGGKIIGYLYVFASLGVLGFLFSTISNKIRTMLEEKKLGFKGTNFKQHIVFLGWDEFNNQVADEIINAGKKIAILTEKKDEVDLIYDHYGNKNVFVLFSDHRHTESYKRLNIKDSSVVFIALSDDSTALKESINLKTSFPNISTVVSLNEASLKETFVAAGVTYVVSRNEIASKLVASYIFEPDVADLNINLISSVGADTDYDVQEYEVTSKNPYLSKDGLELFFSLKKDYDVVLLGLSKLIDGKWTLIPNPNNDHKVELGDYIVLMTNGIGKAKMKDLFNVEEGRVPKVNA